MPHSLSDNDRFSESELSNTSSVQITVFACKTEETTLGKYLPLPIIW